MRESLAGFGMLAVWEFMVIVGVLSCWNEPGRVTVPNSGKTLELHGAPGDVVHLKLPVPADSRADYSELSAEFRSASAPTEEVVLPLHASLDSSESDDVFGSFVVPKFAHETDATGRLSGKVRRAKGEPYSLNVPVVLHVFAPGDGVASGTRDMRILKPVLILVCLALPALGIVVAIALLRETRAERRRARNSLAVTPPRP